MPSLFLRIFVSFWIAMTLITVAFGFIYQAVSTDEKWERWQFLHGQTLHARVEAEAGALRKAGPHGLGVFAHEVQGRTDMRLVVARADTLAADERLTPAARELAERALNERRALHQDKEDIGYFAEPLQGIVDGYVLVGELRRPSRLFWYLGPPDMLPVRFLAILVVSGCVCYFLSRHLTHRIRLIREGSRRLAAGDLSSRIAPKLLNGDDEANALARDLDVMAERIHGLLAAQQRLLRDVSHELRSPLARLGVALELARQASGEELAEHHERIAREAGRLDHLIGEVLMLTRLECRAPNDRQAHAVDLSELVQEVARDANFEARPNGRRVEVVAEEHVTLVGFAEVLRPAVENVVRNAVQFAPSDSEVEVRLERATEGGRRWVRIRVRDRGPGVPEAALESIFRPFFRVSESRNRRSGGGSGVGLAITDRAVRLHGGTVSATNVAGGGLLVSIGLPLS